MLFPRVMVRRVLVLCATVVMLAGSCSSDEPARSSVEVGQDFLLPQRLDDVRVDSACTDAATRFLTALDEQLDVLNEQTFAEWITVGLFAIDDQAPESVAAIGGAVTDYGDANCPQGYLAATVVAHGARFELSSPGAAIYWAGVITTSAQRIGEGATNETQSQAWLRLMAADDPDLSDQAVVPNQVATEAIESCEEVGAAAADLLQQQLYLATEPPFGDPVDEALEPLEPATEYLRSLVDIPECDVVRREILLRQAHEIKFRGPAAVLAYAAELDAAWGFWSSDQLMPTLEFEIADLNAALGELGLIVDNPGNVPMRVLAAELAGVAKTGLVIDILPGQQAVIPFSLGELPEGDVELTMVFQAPTGATQTQTEVLTVTGQDDAARDSTADSGTDDADPGE